MLLGLFRLFLPPPPVLSIEFSWRQSGVNELRRAPSALSNGSSGRRGTTDFPISGPSSTLLLICLSGPISE